MAPGRPERYYFQVGDGGGEAEARLLKDDLTHLLRSGPCPSYEPVIVKFSMCCSALIQMRGAKHRAKQAGREENLEFEYKGWRQMVCSALSSKEYLDRAVLREEGVTDG